MTPYDKWIAIEREVLSDLMKKMCLETDSARLRHMCAVYVFNQEHLHKLEMEAVNWLNK